MAIEEGIIAIADQIVLNRTAFYLEMQKDVRKTAHDVQIARLTGCYMHCINCKYCEGKPATKYVRIRPANFHEEIREVSVQNCVKPCTCFGFVSDRCSPGGCRYS